MGGWVRKLDPWKKSMMCCEKLFIQKKKHGELNCIYYLFYIYHQTFPINKIVLKT